MESYEKPYFQLFCTVCDVIENIELFLGNATLTGTQQQFLRKQIEQLKRVQQITEEMVIAKDEERKTTVSTHNFPPSCIHIHQEFHR